MKQDNLHTLLTTAFSAAVPVLNNPIRLPQSLRRGF
ncbi:MAG: hypothetical protein RIR47_134 [Bacteroidota bacterium]|jgi:hypothetical protein